MSLIYCTECGNKISDKAEKCPHCGCPMSKKVLIEKKDTDVKEKDAKKGYWSTGRLEIGIVSIVLFAVISMQSCVVGAYNTMSMNGEISGTIGFFLAIFMLISGILGICTRNSKQWTGAIICTVFYWLGAFMTIGASGIYADLPIWGIVSFLFGLVFMISAIKTRKGKDEIGDNEGKDEENYNGISDILITVIAIIVFYPAGIIIMWYGKTFNKTARIIITCIFAILTVFIFI